MRAQDLVRKYTDAEYLSKKQISEIVGVSMAETVWRLTTEYREKYRFALEIKRFDKLPFSIVIPPSVMALANTAERAMLKYSMLFETYKMRESFSDNKALTLFKKGIIKDDLLLTAHHQEITISDKDIEMMLKPDHFHLHNTVVWGYYKTVDYLVNKSSEGVTMALIRDMNNCMSNTENTSLFYRPIDAYNATLPPVNEFEGATGSNGKISEHMNMLIEFYQSDYELSPFIIGAIAFAYFLYISPFEKYNIYLATLLMLKIVADYGYGECTYYSSMMQFILQRKDELKDIFDEVKRSGDLTYVITYVCKQFIDALNWKIRSLQKVEMPRPYLDEVKVIEKEVIKEVIKEVPVIKEVEVIKEVPVEKEVIKEVIKEVEKVVYKDREETPEYVEEPTYEEDYIEEQPYVFEPKAEKQARNDYDFLDYDPFASVPVATLNINQNQLKPSKSKLEADKYRKENAKIEKVQAPLAHEEADIITDLSSLEGLENDAYARALVELYPNIKYTQALFYARHKTVGRYYTIGQFKDFLECAYETARTSMEFLTSVGLYRKEQLKNKFVYTPVDLSNNEE